MDGSLDEIRTVGAAAGFRWLWDAINIGRRGAGAVFGGAGLLLLVGVLGGLVFGIVAGGSAAAFRASPTVSFLLGLCFAVPMLLWMALGFVGYLRLIDAVESGRTAKATDALRGFTDFDTGLRAFLVLLVVMVVQQGVMVGLVVWLAPEVGRWYLAVLHGVAGGTPPAAIPAGIWKVYAFSLTFGMLGNAIQSIAIAQVALRDRDTVGALRDGVVGALRNLPALFVLVVCGIAVVLVLLAVVVGVVMLLLMVGKLVALWLAAILAFFLYLALLVAMIAVGGAAMYYLWRDVAGAGGSVAPAVEA
jgi:hypothetical protein